MSRVEGCEETAEVDLEAAEDGRTPEAEAMVLPLACVDERFFVLLINSNQTPNPMLAVPADYRYLVQPIVSAFSRKSRRVIMRPYFLMIPCWEPEHLHSRVPLPEMTLPLTPSAVGLGFLREYHTVSKPSRARHSERARAL